MLVLHLLAVRESYGYELVTRLQDVGLTDLTTGTVYPVLGRLEREGLLTSRLAPSTSGPARKYYRPTDTGTQALADAVVGWHDLSATVAAALATALPTTAAPTMPDPTTTRPPQGSSR